MFPNNIGPFNMNSLLGQLGQNIGAYNQSNMQGTLNSYNAGYDLNKIQPTLDNIDGQLNDYNNKQMMDSINSFVPPDLPEPYIPSSIQAQVGTSAPTAAVGNNDFVSNMFGNAMGAVGGGVGALTGMGGIASLAAGGLNSLGSIAGEGIASLFGKDKVSEQKSAMQNTLDLQEKALQNDIKYQESKNLASMTNSLGMTGQSAALDAQRAMDKNGPTSEAISSSNNMVNQARSGLSGAASQANISKISGQQQAGNMMDIARGTTGNPAAAMAMMGKIGSQLGQNSLQALNAGNDAIAKANNATSNAYGQAGSLLDESRKTNFSTNIAPHLTTVNANNNSANQAIGSGSEASQYAEGMSINPLENGAAYLQKEASNAQDIRQKSGGMVAGAATNYYNLLQGNVNPGQGKFNPGLNMWKGR